MTVKILEAKAKIVAITVTLMLMATILASKIMVTTAVEMLMATIVTLVI